MESVLKTIVYYNSLDYPLTFKEIETFLFKNLKNDSSGLSGNLDGLIKRGLVEKAGGFYFLKGREKLPSVRKERNEIAEKKWRKTLKAIKRLRTVPYLRMVFGSGSLALKNTAKESDLDVLIVVKHGRIWTARFLTIVLLSLLGVRRTRYEKIAPDKICLNHFITDKSLYIPRKSIYTAQLYARLAPILGNEKLLSDFVEANSWIEEYIPNWKKIFNFQSIFNQFSNSKFQNFIKKSGEKILNTKLGDWLEKVLRKYQLRRINNFHLTYKPGGRVKADDESLEFHPDSPELVILEKYNQKMIELGLPELGKERDSGLLRT